VPCGAHDVKEAKMAKKIKKANKPMKAKKPQATKTLLGMTQRNP